MSVSTMRAITMPGCCGRSWSGRSAASGCISCRRMRHTSIPSSGYGASSAPEADPVDELPSDRGPLHETEGVAQTVPHAAVMVTEPSNSAAPEGQLVERALDQLRAHPVYLDVCGPLAASPVPNDAAEFSPIIEPLLTTRDGLILEGHERWAMARQQDRRTMACVEYDLSEEEALKFMLNKCCRQDRLNDFCRIVIALALEPYWRSRARERQRKEGKNKLLSKLTKGNPIDVRAELARAAGVGAGNITKVKQLLKTITPAVQDALRRGDVTIHRAWQ